ncbi:MAG TPA: serine hydrolase domain-containing protein [Vicinamibacterales bacterium]|nr:serine hydrolase domain-containing protein [Vicinamibacterales bacterium]
MREVTVAATIPRIALCLLALASTTTAQADPTDDFITAQMRSQNIPGLSLAIVKDRKIVKMQGYGLADVKGKVPATPETVYDIASIGKPLVATGIMLLVEDGLLSIDDAITKHLDGLPRAWSGITIRHLLTHTSGVVRDSPGYDQYRDRDDSEVIRTAYSLPLRFAPGEKWEYSNAGYSPLAMIMTKVARRPWTEYLADKIFRPAGMISTYPLNTTVPLPKRARGYADNDTPLKEANQRRALVPAGGFLSTVVDLAKWDAWLDDATFLRDTTRRQMWTSVTLNNGTTHPYGLGWELDGPVLGRRVVRHGGSVIGFRSEFVRFVDDRLTIILLMNLHDVDWQTIRQGVARLHLPAAPSGGPTSR